ncbi:MAG: HAD-IC family P-type ATPase [archaeon]
MPVSSTLYKHHQQHHHHAKEISEALSELGTSKEGLSSAEAERRLAAEGRNIISEGKKTHALVVFISQFKSLPIILLMLASLFSFMVSETNLSIKPHFSPEGLAIALIILINALIGFFQEVNAEKAIAALRKLSALKVKVLRDGLRQLSDAVHIVPGDIIFLETGDKIPADARILEHHAFSVMEATLTGESVPSRKHADALHHDTPLAERKNMVYSGTIVTSGRAIAAVAATGNKTEIGKIAKAIEEMRFEDTPLQKSVERMAKYLSYAVIAFSIAVFILLVGILGKPPLEILLLSVAMIVAALPEGLPIVMTITSAVGVRKMVHRHVLVRKLASIETLGSVSVICTDKTGTLTKNQMTVSKLFYDGSVVEVSGEGYSPHGNILGERTRALEMLLQIGALCNNASMFHEKVSGDPTEIALIASAAKGGINTEELERVFRRIDEFEFTSERKIMSTVNILGANPMLLVKGAPDEILKRSTRMLYGGNEIPLHEQHRREILEANDIFSREALRVLGFAYRPLYQGEEPKEDSLVFVGLQAMLDPPREEVRTAVERCRKAGIRVIMITGDHAGTAVAVARSLGLEPKVITGTELDALSDIDRVVEDVVIYARTSPEHKLKIVNALQAKGCVVAMTGDGVNDAPALKKANIGIAMGISGTDVAKEASAMVLIDDNFSSIVSAVEEGRGIYENIRKFIRYQISTNVGAIVLILSSIVISLPLPLVPVQLLWINISIDGPPALSLGLEPTRASELMSKKPRNSKESLISRQMLLDIFLSGAIMAAGTLAVFAAALSQGASLPKAQTIAFTTFALFQIFNVLNCRSFEESIFKIGPLSNKVTLYSIAALMVSHLFIVYAPFLQGIFRTVALSPMDWLVSFAVAVSILAIYEVIKAFPLKIRGHAPKYAAP